MTLTVSNLPRRSFLAAVAVLATGLSATAQPIAEATRPGICPLDGGRLASTASTPWNLGGGIDTDGCPYSIDEAGRRWVPAGRQLIVCVMCGAGFLHAQRELRLTVAESARVRAALSSAKQTGPTRRWETAALALTTLGSARLGIGGNLEAHVGELLLRGAWAARAIAVTPGPTAGYAPLSIQEARLQLKALEQRITRDPRLRSAVVELEELLTGLEGTRLRLSRIPNQTLPLSARRSLLRSRTRLGQLERQLLSRKLARLTEASGDRERLTARQMREALARAWIRFGTPMRWSPLVEKLGPAGDLMREACREEARLLAQAGPLFLDASRRTVEATEKSRLLFLAGDCARRRGESEAWQHLEAAARLASDSKAGRNAAALLGR